MTLERKLVRNTFFRFLWPTMASALMLSVQDSDRVYLRIRDNLTEWTPQGLDQPYGSFLRALEQDSGVNEAGFNIIWKISKEHSYKRTIGYNNFAVIL